MNEKTRRMLKQASQKHCFEGEKMIVEKTQLSEGDCGYHKIWVDNGNMFGFLHAVIGAPSTLKVIETIIMGLNSENAYIKTQQELATDSNVALGLAKGVMKKLQGADCMRKRRVGYYIFNPHLLYKGNGGKREKAIRQWDACEKK